MFNESTFNNHTLVNYDIHIEGLMPAYLIHLFTSNFV